MTQLTDEAFELIVDSYSKMLFKIAYSYTKNIADSEDIVQEVFMKFYRARKNYENEEHIKNWLIRVAINQSLNVIKHNNKSLPVENEYFNNLPDTLENNDRDEEIRKIVMSLKEKYKTIIILFYYDNYNVKEIANILNISESNVKVRLNRARIKIKDILEKGKH